ncbi:4-phosphopantetheinyl transferase [filamentous cyanobacterium CCP3]|nr:4-phosphopantetheinyl transferase [filamentous cyanobacterium CCP3]
MSFVNIEEVYLWFSLTAHCQEPELIKTYTSWLDDQEHMRYQQFRFPRHRHEYLVAHALLRNCLSRYGDRQPWAWRFSINAYGRPEIQVEEGAPPLRFNLAHTEGLVACAVTRSADIGVDVERTTRKGDLVAIAASSLTSHELAVLDRLKGQAWRDRFFDLWTLKEAYVKARGLGLSLPLKQFAFQLESDGLRQIRFESDSEANPPKDWRFGLMSPTPNHRLAFAVRCSKLLRVQIGWAIPEVVFQAVQLPIVTSQGVE